ncbi:hypothetical protein OSCT_1255 [Oscillochloris trichoides DG-6]|uniref:General stress protein 17M-like domain-containing protein n=1 Tax=Oscillochloris trichoides DG-6 TaxID=765420 RepID=E1ID54_9CHLR|nr:hypothetical protein [Oscillochloris trichoides]EFO80886.1 hypothetical protein OSCT_1255 [Oscillochloris trichoides DG-6]
MIRTVTGLFDTLGDAQSAASELIDRGISREDISMVVRDASDTNIQQHEVGAENPMTSGAVSGSVVGGAVGLLVGAGLLAIPGIGPVLAFGPLAAAIGTIGATAGSTALGAGIGAGVGGLAGALMGNGVPEDSAHIYAEGVRRGGVLLTVSVDSAMDERVNVDAVLHRYGVVDINQRSKEWHKTDWNPPMTTGTAPSDFTQGQRSAPPTLDFTQGQRSVLPTPDFTQGQRSAPPTLDFTNTTNERDFQTHYQSTLAAGGRPYSDYAPAYTFGTDMATNARVHGHTWDAVASDLRRRWEQNYPNTWNEFEAAVRYAWEKAHGQP